MPSRRRQPPTAHPAADMPAQTVTPNQPVLNQTRKSSVPRRGGRLDRRISRSAGGVIGVGSSRRNRLAGRGGCWRRSAGCAVRPRWWSSATVRLWDAPAVCNTGDFLLTDFDFVDKRLCFAGRRKRPRRRGCGGIGRRAGFRCLWASARGGSTPLIRIFDITFCAMDRSLNN